MRTTFVFAKREVRCEHATLAAAVAQANHIVASWPTVRGVVIHGDRRDGYPYITTVTSRLLACMSN